MSISFKRSLIFIVVATLAYLSWWLNTRTTSVTTVSDKTARHDPDYYADNLTVLSLDATGRPEYRLKVENILHFPDDNTAELKQPDMRLYQNNSVSWRITANKGLVSADGKQVDLSENVVVTQQHADPGATLTTGHLTVMPDSKTVETQAHVLVKDKAGQTEATGMSADLNNHRLHLKSAVRGMYENP